MLYPDFFKARVIVSKSHIWIAIGMHDVWSIYFIWMCVKGSVNNLVITSLLLHTKLKYMKLNPYIIIYKISEFQNDFLYRFSVFMIMKKGTYSSEISIKIASESGLITLGKKNNAENYFC